MTKITSLTDLVSVRTLEKIQDNFVEATGIACVMRDLKGNTITKFTKPSHLWQEVIKHPSVESELQPALIQGLDKCLKTSQVQIIQRYMDTYAFISPIGIDGKTFGFLVGGLTRFKNPQMATCAKEAVRLNIDLDDYLEMFLELPLVTSEKLEACGNLFKIVGSSISNLAKEGTEAKAKISEMTSINNQLGKEVEQASFELKESDKRYQRLFNEINDGIYETDMEGRITDINPAGAHILGYNRNELIGFNMRNLYVNPTDRDPFVRKIIREGRVDQFYPHIKHKNGQTTYFETNSILVKDQNGRPVGIQGIFRDISGRPHHSLNKDENVTAKTAVIGSKNHQKPHLAA
jgi:PAS domain S-box-containing protein